MRYDPTGSLTFLETEQHASAAKAPAFSKLLLAMTAGATAGVFLSERNRTFSAEEKKNFSIAKSYSEISKQRLSRYQSLFLKNASVEDPQGNPFLSKADFLKAIKPELDLIDIDVEKFSVSFLVRSLPLSLSVLTNKI